MLLSWNHIYQRVFETPENTAAAIEEFARYHGTTASALKVLVVCARARRADLSFFARQCVAWPVIPQYLCRTRLRKSLIVWTRSGIAAKDVDTQGRRCRRVPGSNDARCLLLLGALCALLSVLQEVRLSGGVQDEKGMRGAQQEHGHARAPDACCPTQLVPGVTLMIVALPRPKVEPRNPSFAPHCTARGCCGSGAADHGAW